MAATLATFVRPPARWLDPPAVRAEHVAALRAQLGLPDAVCAFLAARGMTDVAGAQRFVRTDLSQLHAPELLRDADRATDRLVRAVSAGERIFVHGDYDVDGITSTVLLTRVLRRLGAAVVPFVPHRVRDGYDLGEAGVRAAVEARAKVVVTCDCGTTAHGAVAALNSAGIDVIITDHHLPPDGSALPPAYAVLNPRRHDCEYPDKDLVAGGVVFKLALSVVRACGADEAIVLELLDLVALATVADVAPLRGENRVLVQHGLRVLANSRVPGMRALIRSSGLERKDVTAGRAGFILAPRLNAAGRVGHAMRGVELLLTDSESDALGIARELEEQNRRRQDLDRATLEEARGLLAELDADSTAGIVLAREGWHPGVIGIVASRVVEQTGRPTMLIALDNGVGKGSGRSVPAFDLHGALTACRERFLRFGGHRAAAGITIAAGEVDAFARAFNDIAAAQLTAHDFAAELRLDVELSFEAATDDLLSALRACEPHGVGNAAPVFFARGVRATAAPKRIGETGIRTRLAAGERGAGASIDAIAWDFADRSARVNWGAPMDVAYRLERDEWNGRSRVQARIVDVRQ